MNITIIPVSRVDEIWPLVAEGLERACAACGGDISAGDLWQQCRGGSAFLIVVHEQQNVIGASVWRPERWSTGLKLRCLALYGSKLLKWIKPLRGVVIKLMEDCGAQSLVTEGLEKWGAVFRRMCPNARRVRVLYEEEVKYGREV